MSDKQGQQMQEDLQTLLYHLSEACRILSDNQKALARDVAVMDKLSQEFAKHLQNLSNQKMAVIDNLKSNVQREAREIEIALRAQIEKTMKQPIGHLHHSVTKIQERAEKWPLGPLFATRWGLGVVCAICIFVSIVTVLATKISACPPPRRLESEMLPEIYNAWNFKRALFTRISEKEKEKLSAIASGQLKSKEKVKEDLRAEHPDYSDEMINSAAEKEIKKHEQRHLQPQEE